MTHIWHILTFSLILLILSGIASGSNQTQISVNRSNSTNFSDIIEVADVQSILSNPPQYYGKTISLNAVVSKTSPEKKMFTVSDRVGCSLCTEKNAKNSITIRYAGENPKYLDIVRITGEVVPEKTKGFHINATAVKR